MGFHSATDTYHENETYWQMIGGTFVSHPWTSGKLVTVDVYDTEHPASRPFGHEFTIKDEIYRYRHWQPDKVHVLMGLNMEKCLPILDKGGKNAYFKPRNDPTSPWAMPLAWVKDWGQGKVFYTNLGHNETTWTNKTFLKSVEGAVRWIRGLESGDATPNPQVSKAEELKAQGRGSRRKNGSLAGIRRAVTLSALRPIHERCRPSGRLGGWGSRSILGRQFAFPARPRTAHRGRGNRAAGNRRSSAGGERRRYSLTSVPIARSYSHWLCVWTW